jgi:hypothetical protein
MTCRRVSPSASRRQDLHEPLITINDGDEELGVFALGIPHTALWIRWRGRNHSIRTADLFKSLLAHIAPRDAERLP